ncbi:MAG: 23S rRNA (pseudouridine(1915)-N(3))-methyltransferase RlmH [Nanoarchaeota archaeon]
MVKCRIKILAVGKLKDAACIQLCEKYQKRLRRSASIEVVPIRPSPLPQDPSPKERQALAKAEWSQMQKHLDGFVVALDEKGEEWDSVQFSKLFTQHNRITFIIGGAMGLSADCRAAADLTLAFSKMTFPHPLFQAILHEQIYRGILIAEDHPYHNQ